MAYPQLMRRPSYSAFPGMQPSGGGAFVARPDESVSNGYVDDRFRSPVRTRSPIPMRRLSSTLRAPSMLARCGPDDFNNTSNSNMMVRTIGPYDSGRALTSVPAAGLSRSASFAGGYPGNPMPTRMIGNPQVAYYIPRPLPADVGKLVVVLDLDETLVYARERAVIERPGVQRLLSVLDGRCEVVVWTAAEKDYAVEAIRTIDRRRCVKHCVHRHPKWWNPFAPSVKDVRCLGRPMDQTILIDNTPECLKSNPTNSILVSDFRGYLGSGEDTTLVTLAQIIQFLLESPTPSVSRLAYCPMVQMRNVVCQDGTTIQTYVMPNNPPDERSYPIAPNTGNQMGIRW